MQLQLHVTGLAACDYIEAAFSSPYNNDNVKEGPALYSGFIVLVRHSIPQSGQEYYYVYSPINCDNSWQPMVEDDDMVEIIPWRLYKWSEQVVYKSEEWWQKTCPVIEEFWRDVEKCKRGEFTAIDSTRPTKKLKAAREEKCMITFTRLPTS